MCGRVQKYLPFHVHGLLEESNAEDVRGKYFECQNASMNLISDIHRYPPKLQQMPDIAGAKDAPNYMVQPSDALGEWQRICLDALRSKATWRLGSLNWFIHQIWRPMPMAALWIWHGPQCFFVLWKTI